MSVLLLIAGNDDDVAFWCKRSKNLSEQRECWCVDLVGSLDMSLVIRLNNLQAFLLLIVSDRRV